MQKEIVDHEYIICVGSNDYAAINQIKKTFDILKQKFTDIVFSDVIETKAIDMDIDCIFHNAIVWIKTSISPALLKTYLKETEIKLGRTSSSNIILIDMDIIIIDNNIVHKDYEKKGFIRSLIQNLPINLNITKQI